MNTPFEASALPDQHLAQALPLVQVTWPETDLPSWLTFARSVQAEGGGLLVLREVDDYICGVLAYRRQASLSGPVLSVPLFTVADLSDRPSLAQTLIDAAEDLGKRLGCQAAHLEFHLRQARLVDRLRRLGSPAELFLLQLRWE